MRTIAADDRFTYEKRLSNSRESRVRGFVETGTCAIAMRFLPAWMIDSSVYENSDTIVIRSAASRVYARNPLVVSGTDVFDTWRTTQLPSRCNCRLRHDMCRSSAMFR